MNPPAARRRLPRRAGILLHPTSLPGGCGVGDFGPSAEAFTEFLARAKAGVWQVLPLGPVGFGGSPYAARSSFAIAPHFLSIDQLRADGFLSPEEAAAFPPADQGPAHFDLALTTRLAAAERALARFDLSASAQRRREFEVFGHSSGAWLDDWALYAALSETHEGRAWTDWGGGLARREPAALDYARRELAGRIRLHAFVQWLVSQQWQRIRRIATSHGIAVWGDVPIFVAHDSADVWSRQYLFDLDASGAPRAVAGVPPDYFSVTGQRWGNPLYRWDVHRVEGYAWWISRIRAALTGVDVVRLDHFRGFDAYWEIPADAPTAERGAWIPGPGKALFDAIESAVGGLPFIAEDLGVITPEVEALKSALGLPGMKILQFAFGSGPANPYLPYNCETNAVVYSGTHDNDTSAGWYAAANDRERDHVRRYVGVDGANVAWDFIRMALATVADTAIVPMQDLLSLPSEARMNLPGTDTGNWRWRLTPEMLAAAPAERFADLVNVYGREPAGS